MSILLSDENLTESERATLNEWSDEIRERLQDTLRDIIHEKSAMKSHPTFLEPVEDSHFGSLRLSSPGAAVPFRRGGKLVMSPVNIED